MWRAHVAGPFLAATIFAQPQPRLCVPVHTAPLKLLMFAAVHRPAGLGKAPVVASFWAALCSWQTRQDAKKPRSAMLEGMASDHAQPCVECIGLVEPRAVRRRIQD